MTAGKKKPEDKKPDPSGTGHSLRDDAEELLSRSQKPSPDSPVQTPEALIHELQVHQIELEIQAEELRKSKLALEESRDTYLDLYDFAPVGYLTLNDKALITGANLTGAKLLGLERSRLVNAPFSKFVVEKDAGEWRWYFMNVLNQREKRTCTLMLKRGGGPLFPAQLEAIMIPHSDGVNTVRIAIIDITGIRRNEDALRESEEKYRALFAAESDGIFVVDKETGIIIDCNDAITLMYGYRKDEVIGQPNTGMSAEPDATRAATQECKGHIPVRYHKRKDGSIFPVEITANVVSVKEHDVIVAAVRDITERKVAEEALALASKKLTLLSGITRHDINNQLTILLGYHAMLEKKQPDLIHNNYFCTIKTAAQRISSMILFTKEYEKIGVKAPVWQDCCTLVDTAAKQAPLGKVVVKNDLPAGQEIYADPLVEKVFYNLMDNAARYGGKITTIRFSFEVHNDDQVMVCEDDGIGIPVNEKDKIFERGFGKNTGLGLALSQEILSITGITIRETGEPGKGARFEMTVPKEAWRIGKDV
jgi:PAS domain S-box-containing protein